MLTGMNFLLARLLLVVVVALGVTAAARGEDARSVLDAAWTPVVSDGATVRVTPERGAAGGTALRIDFDFTRGAGFGGVTFPLAVELPENYEFALTLRGEGPANNLEFKLVDDTDQNVWWVNRRGYEWPAAATTLAMRKRHFGFAWGPGHGGALRKLGRVELVVASNEGGRGTVWVEGLTFRALEPSRPYTGTPTISASATARGDAATLLRDGGGSWIAPLGEERPTLTIDFGQARELGGVAVRFDAGAPVHSVDLEATSDGAVWTRVSSAAGLDGFDLWLATPDLEARAVRLVLHRANAGLPAGVRRVEVLPLEAGASMNALWAYRAARAVRGAFPRTALNEQAYWTVLGAAGDGSEALIDQEGRIELGKRRAAVEPVLAVDGTLLTWADATHEQSLAEGWAPIATVRRTHADAAFTLETTAFVSGEAGASTLQACYTITNTGASRRGGRLVLLVRPWQVLPPWQDLNIAGGWAPTRRIENADGALVVDGGLTLATPNYARAGVLTFDQGDPVEWLRAGRWPTGLVAACPRGAASGMIEFEWDLPAGQSASYVLTVPLHGAAGPPDKRARPLNREQFDRLAQAAQRRWHDVTGRALIAGPPAAREFLDTVRATQAYILINRDGPGFQPGSRTYERSWIRDGSMTSAAMLEFGHVEPVREFIDWFAPYQFPSGKVPCVVDRRGADPVPEHDSHGQLIWLIANYHRYTGDIDLVRRHLARVKLAVDYIQSLRRERMTEEFGASGPARQEPGKPPVPALAFRGLVPASISHEGYSAKPMHSYWDTLFLLRGLKDAAYLASVVSEPELAKAWQAEADGLRESIRASVEAVHAAHGIDYWPGCVELGDFDSTSSTIVMWPVEVDGEFPKAWTDATFERFWRNFEQRRNENTWDAYTPYELRHVNALVRLGQKERALAVLDWYMGHRRPAGWREWAEVVWRDPATPKMIGDMPHTWCGSDFLNAARAMLLYEDRADGALVLFAGLPEAWANGEEFRFEGLLTEAGSLTAGVQAAGDNAFTVRISGAAKPAGGFRVCSPRAGAVRSATINGTPAKLDERGRVIVPADAGRPITVEIVH